MKNKITLFTILFALLIAGNSSAQVPSGITGVKINEVDYDQPGTDTSEFIELYNSGSLPVDISTYKVVLFNGASSTIYNEILLPATTLNGNSFFVLCGNSGVIPNCDMVLTATSNIIQNGAPDAIAILDTSTSTIIDVVSYEGDCITPYIEGTGVPSAQSDSTLSYTSMGRYPDGSDNDSNAFDFHVQCITPGAPNTNVDSNCTSPLSVVAVGNPVEQIHIYPNPASEKIFVLGITRSQSTSFAHMYDIEGKICLTQTVPAGSSGIVINVSTLQNGIYSVVVNAENFSAKKTFVVAR